MFQFGTQLRLLALLGLASLASATPSLQLPAMSGGHSCYYFVVHESGCKPETKGGASYAACQSCAAKALPKEPTSYEHCNQTLIDAACHGILPPSPTPAPPKAGDLALTLLPDAAKEKGAVCLDGSPAGCKPAALSHLASR